MLDLRKFLSNYSGKTLLVIFAHPDDESFVAGGLLQVAKEQGLKTKLICLTKGERGINGLKKGGLKKLRTKELKVASKVLEIDEVKLWSYPDANLRKTKVKWATKVKKEIIKKRPDIIVTFGHSGITGHPDHIVSCHEVIKIVKSLKNKPVLFWRVPDEQDKRYFKHNKALKYASKPNMVLQYGLSTSLKKIRAIYSHRSQMQGLMYKLQILEWYLFDHKEMYYKVDLKKSYQYRFVTYRA